MEVDLVIGADGANSRVAREIDAGDYDYAIAFQERIKICDEDMEYYKDLAGAPPFGFSHSCCWRRPHRREKKENRCPRSPPTPLLCLPARDVQLLSPCLVLFAACRRQRRCC